MTTTAPPREVFAPAPGAIASAESALVAPESESISVVSDGAGLPEYAAHAASGSLETHVATASLGSLSPEAALVAAVENVAAVQARIDALMGARTRAIAKVHALARVVEGDLVDETSPRAREASASRRAELAERAVVADLACALRVSDRTAQGLVAEAETLTTQASATLEALCAGSFSYNHARILAETLTGLDLQASSEVEAACLHRAAALTPGAFRRLVHRVRERVHPEPPALRHTRAVTKRAVWVDPGEDGMAWLSALLPAVSAHAIHDRLTTTAARCRAGGDERTTDQLRADALVDLLLDRPDQPDGSTQSDRARCTSTSVDAGSSGRPGTGLAGAGSALTGMGSAEPGSTGTGPASPGLAGPGFAERDQGVTDPVFAGPSGPVVPSLGDLARRIVPRVHVTVPVLTLLGGDEPGSLDGYGPVDPDTATLLAAKAPSFRRLLTHPETGAVLSVGRDSYTVPADLRAWLTVRDGTCRFPGCLTPARRTDLDHTTDFARGGATDSGNLAHLCRKHHVLKHETTWTVQHQPGGVMRWTSPTGRTHVTEPVTRLTPEPSPLREPPPPDPGEPTPSDLEEPPPSPAWVLEAMYRHE